MKGARGHEGVWPLPVFGLTGSIASGKSTFGRFLAALGAQVADADRLGHRLLWKGRPAHRRVVAEFGPGVLGPRGGIDRRKLAGIVFRDAAARRRLEAILHPAIMARVHAWADGLALTRARVAVLEAALLCESGMDDLLDGCVVVLARPSIRVARLVGARRHDEEEALRRVAAQWSDGRKAARASWVVRNEGTLAELEREARRVWSEMLGHPAVRPARGRGAG
jgi:dephospho-CoA kinase